MREEKLRYILSKYNPNKNTFKKKDSKQTKVTLLIKDYFKNNTLLTKDKFDDFLKFIDLKTIWRTRQEQEILWNSIISYSNNKTSINYDAALKGIMDLFKSDDEDKKNINVNLKENFSKEDDNETFDKYLKNLNGIQELYDIQFINYIFLDKNNMYINSNSIDNIINDIKSKYKFITISERDIKAYFNCFKSNIINKDLINNINTSIENLIEQNKINSKFKNFKRNSRIISFSSSSNDINSNKNINSYSLNHSELFDKLLALDKNILDIIESLIYFYKNNNILELFQKYIQNYLNFTKNKIYDNLKFLIENDDIRKMSEESNNNIDNNIDNNNSKIQKIVIKKEVKVEKSSNLINIRNRKVKFSIEYDDNKNDNNNDNDNKNNNNYNINNSINNNNDDNDNNDEPILRKNLLYKKGKYINNNKNDDQEIFSPNNKLKKNISYTNLNKLNKINDLEIEPFHHKKKISSRNINLTESKYAMTQRDEDSNSFNEGSIEDLTEFTFNDNDKLLLQTANMDNLEDDDNNNLPDKGTPTLNSIDNKDLYDYYYEDYYNDNNSNKKEENNNKENQNLLNCQNPNDFTFGKEEKNNNNGNTIKIKLSGDIDSGEPNYMNKNDLLSLSNQNNKKFIKIGYFDFKYLYKNKYLKKLFNQYNDKLNPMKLLSDEIYVVSNNVQKKQKGILVISGSYIYLLKSNSKLDYISKINIKLLNAISISSRNCNLIIFNFEKNPDIIIETYRRIEILKFIKDILNEKTVKINISHNYSKKKPGEIDSKIAKIIAFTPNYENAQKFGTLYKYQDNFFSAKFQEKFVVLCCLGLMYFDENEKTPKAIIPIIGTTIKFVTVQWPEKYYCFQLKTINEDNYIFGSKAKIEIFDWIREFSLVKKKYFSKLKDIEPNLVLHEKNKPHK